MSNGFIIRPVPLTPAQLTGGSTTGSDPAFPVGNLANPQPKVVFRTNAFSGHWALYIDVDLLTDTYVDTVALLYTNAGADTQWFAQGSTDEEGTAPIDANAPGAALFDAIGGRSFGFASTITDPARHAVIAGTGRNVRHVRVWVTGTVISENLFRAGVLVLGQRWISELPFANFELGSGRKITDLSDKRQLPGGEVGRWAKAKVPGFRATWSNMTDADLRRLWQLLTDVGLSSPIVLVEDPDATAGLNERIHYCTIDGLDYYQRVQFDKSSIELKITDWL